MTPYLALAIALFAGIILGGTAVYWLGKRPTTTKAEALKLLTAEYALVAKMPGAAEAQAEALAQAEAEALAAKQLAAMVMKASGAAVA